MVNVCVRAGLATTNDLTYTLADLCKVSATESLGHLRQESKVHVLKEGRRVEGGGELGCSVYS